MVAFSLGLGFMGSPRSRMAAIRQAAISRGPRSRSSGMSVSLGEQKANSQPRYFRNRELHFSRIGEIILHSRRIVMWVLSQRVAGFSSEVPANLSDKQVQKRLSSAARKAFFKLADAWKIRDEEAKQLLGGISNGGFYQLKGGEVKAPLDEDRLVRVSLLVGIFKALNTLYSQKLADAWISLPNSNPMFAGEAPLAYMVKGGQPAMMRVRQLLDARRVAG